MKSTLSSTGQQRANRSSRPIVSRDRARAQPLRRMRLGVTQLHVLRYNIDMSNADTPGASTGGTATAPAKPRTNTKTVPRQQQLPPYNVVLLDDDDHTYEYVILMLRRIFGHPEERGMQLAKQVDTSGRAIVLTTHREHAELKRDQILSFGADPRLSRSRGSMSATIEPAEGA
jgi:ATP-dependent Clp protease adaptor protein ClpS